MERYFTKTVDRLTTLYYWRTSILLIKKRRAIFNEYFINIADDLPRPKQSQNGLNFTYHPSIHGINITPITINPIIVKNIVLSLSLSKAMGWDSIPIRIIKDSIDSIAWPLSNLFHYSISTNTIPQYWKFAQITPVFRKRR